MLRGSAWLISLQRREIQSHISEVWRRFIEPCIALVILLLSPVVQAQEKLVEEGVGYVLGISGDWFLDGSPPQKIDKGHELPAGSTVRAKSSNARHSYIDIVFYDKDKEPVSLSCDSAGACEQSISLPRSIKSESSLVRIMKLAKGFLSRQPRGKDVIFAMGRGGGNLREAVIKLVDGQVDLSPAFKSMEKGLYLLRFEIMTRDGESGSGMSLGPIVFNWDPNNLSPILISDLRPGLYKVSLLEPNTKEHEPTGIEAWVLVSGSREYEKASASFQEALVLAEQWSKKLKLDSIRSFLRAYLEYLATKGTK